MLIVSVLVVLVYIIHVLKGNKEAQDSILAADVSLNPGNVRGVTITN